MALIPGHPLEEKWDTLDEKSKESVCLQVWGIISKIRAIPRPSEHNGLFQCAADGSPTRDPLLEDLKDPARPLTNDSDLRARIFERYFYFGGRQYEHQLLNMLPRSDCAVFTHADIARRNIMIDERNNVTGILDWEYVGWYPDYWDGVHKSSTLRREEENRPLAPTDGTKRYNLWPNRCRSFRESLPQYPVDRLRFPHFSKSYKNHLKLHGVPDRDYSDWFKWNQKVNEFIRISAVADDGTTPPLEEDEARQWTHCQKFYSAMITAKLTHNAAQRINAFEISRVQSLIKAVKDNLKPEGTGTYVNLQRRYMCVTREKCGSAQALGAEIRRIHAEKLLLDPDCVISEIERTFFFMHALGPYSHTGARKPLKRRPTTDNEDDDVGGPKDPKKPTFMATEVSGDVNKAFGKDVEGNFAVFPHPHNDGYENSLDPRRLDR
ncbi:aminoglycoside phosphotransferase family protein [Aspergillus tanneri]|uniref:Aminoglycoside phosphotransferase domain-containing protein n=1 Tax=Aspergillus tanneri TaxID=1220188 RepID=A0A5M9MGY7_9EURO|nr:uncharacterized protein ATNIH1004_009247 [Aspergillus tanneri]KAA8645036.1 hypothetical protein ATNIH1004_009247 [Aspergillus tanneri]